METAKKYWWVGLLIVVAIAAVVAWKLTAPDENKKAPAPEKIDESDNENYNGPELLSQNFSSYPPTTTGTVGPSLPPEVLPGQANDHYTRVEEEEPWYKFW